MEVLRVVEKNQSTLLRHFLAVFSSHAKVEQEASDMGIPETEKVRSKDLIRLTVVQLQ